jgi:hypothetical protein
VKISVWQFLGLIVVGAGLYYFYTNWWIDQDRNTWIDRFNGNVYNSPEEMNKQEDTKPAPSSTWP